jgi:CubicO group peptidase (beta-lactamase class C family)
MGQGVESFSPLYELPPYLTPVLKVIDRWLAYKRVYGRIPGLAVGVVHKNKTVFTKSYGYADLETRKKLTPKTCFRLASISKVFTAVAVMRLVEAERLRLDDRIHTHLPWFKSHQDKRLVRITIRQLLTHSSGLKRDGDTAHWVDDNFPSLEMIKRQVQSGLTVYPPSQRFKYSNLGYAILGQIVEAAAGKSYEQYVKEIIIDGLGLTHTYPDLTRAARRRLAVGYGRDTPGLKRSELPPAQTKAMAPATGFVSNVEDLCKFLSAQFIGSGKLLTDESKREMQRINWFRGENHEQYGLGYEIWRVGNRWIAGHGGSFQGYRSKVGLEGKGEIGVVVLTNAIDAPALSLTNGIFHTINYFRKEEDKFKSRSESSKGSLGKYEGRFSGRWGDIEIVAAGDRLLGFWWDGDRPTEYVYELGRREGNEFRIISGFDKGYIGETIKFEFDKNKNLVGLIEGPNPMELVESSPGRSNLRRSGNVGRGGG